MTITVAAPASAIAPCGPAATTRSTSSSAAGGLLRVSLASMSWVLQWGGSMQRRLAQLADVADGHRQAAIAPCRADIRDDGSRFHVVQFLCERRHPVRLWIALRARREAAVQH